MLFLCWQSICRLDIVTLTTSVGNKINLYLLTVIAFTKLYYSDIYTISSYKQLIIYYILHKVSFLNLSKIQPGIPKAYIGKIILERSRDIPFAFHIITTGTTNKKSILKIVKVTLNS